MKFIIVFSTENDVFKQNLGAEVEGILNQVQDQLFDHSPFGSGGFGRLLDSNGQRVGYWAHQDGEKL